MTAANARLMEDKNLAPPGDLAGVQWAKVVTEAEADAAFNRRMELTQLCAGMPHAVGHVLTESDALAIKELMDEMEEIEATACDAYADGEKRGREEAGGQTVAKLMAERDELRLDLSVQKALVRFAYADRDARALNFTARLQERLRP